MKFSKAFKLMHDEGKLIKLPNWGGYWFWDKEKKTIIIHTKDNKEFDIRDTTDVKYTFDNICSKDWMVYDSVNDIPSIPLFTFDIALRSIKHGKKLTRIGWNGKDMYVVRQKGYPEGVPCNKQTAECYGIMEGSLFKCNPYYQIKLPDGSYSMWIPSVGDIEADDWTYYNK